MEDHNASAEEEQSAMRRLYDHLDEIQREMDDLRASSPVYGQLCEEVEAKDGSYPTDAHKTDPATMTQTLRDGHNSQTAYIDPIDLEGDMSDEGYASANFPQPSPPQDLASPPQLYPEPPQRKYAPDDSRLLLPGTNIWSDYASVMLTYQKYVLSWRTTFGYTDEEMTLVIQYFEQVSQVAGQEVIDEIFAQRTPEILARQSYTELHPLDPLVKFSQGERPGIPSIGFTLSAEGFRTASIPPVKHQKQWKTKSKSERWQLADYKGSWEPLGVGTTCVDILRHYPNHIFGEFLDSFAQYGFTSRQMLQWIPDSVQEKLVQTGALKITLNTAGERMSRQLDNRRSARRDKSRRWYGEHTDATFLATQVCIRRSGL